MNFEFRDYESDEELVLCADYESDSKKYKYRLKKRLSGNIFQVHGRKKWPTTLG